MSAIFTILFLIQYVYYPGQSVKESLVNQSNGFEDVALNVDTKKTQNLELCWMPLISQDSLQWKTLSIMSYTKPWDANRIGTGPVLAKVSSKYLFKFPGHYYM